MTVPLRSGCGALLAICAIAWCGPALAYRPFDGTDAAVADPGEVEVELGPIGYLHDGPERTLIAPAARINYGIAERWEAVLEGEWTHGLSAGRRTSRLTGDAASLKGVLRDGSLQGKPGLSVATEAGLLLPGINDEPGTGGSLAAVVSQRWPALTLHLNLLGAVTRRGHGDLFAGIIGEGPSEWPVRPVAELFYERAFGELAARSVLIGAIWRARSALDVDFGLRAARVNDHTLTEFRAGLTFRFTP